MDFDTTKFLSKYLNKYLIIKLFDFIKIRGICSSKNIDLTKIKLLENTFMIDYIFEIYNRLEKFQIIILDLLNRKENVRFEIDYSLSNFR